MSSREAATGKGIARNFTDVDVVASRVKQE